MAQSPDHPELTFIQAMKYGTGRSLNMRPLWIVIHDMEAGEFSNTAETTAAYFARGADGRNVSSHYCVDDNSVIQCVLLKDTAWTVGNAPGNNRGINWELAGFARQTRAEWLDAFGLAMFRQMAPIVRADAAKFGIPLVKLTVKQVLSGRPGITSHNDLRVAFDGTTHTDPGPSFPWDVFVAMMQGEEDDLNQEQDTRLHATSARMQAWARGEPTVKTTWAKDPNGVEQQWGVQRIMALEQQVAELQRAVEALSTGGQAFPWSVTFTGSGSITSE